MFNLDAVREPYAEATVERFQHYIGNKREGKDYGTQHLNPLGKHPDDWWQIQPIAPSAKERLGYPTQKPLALLERIIAASSNPGDIILDPFCGCGTAVIAAENLGRVWIGIEITHLAIAVQKYRLKLMFPDAHYQVIGEPVDVASAQQLAHDDRYQFQFWACSLVQAKPLGGQEGSREGKKGSDKGIDGVKAFIDEASGKPKQVIVQVKSGHVGRGQISELVGTIEREQAAIGVFITLEDPTEPMRTEALSAGYYHSPGWNKDYPRIQILTIDELLHGADVQMPPQLPLYKEIPKIPQTQTSQRTLAAVG